MNEIRTSGPLLFTEPNNPTRVGEIINTLNEIYDIPMPRLGMSVYVKDEGVNYTITKLEPKLIEGVWVPDAKVAGYELQTGKSIAWNSSSNVNDYVVAGVYNITGERLNVNDGLPIANSNPGHTISARLVVLDSSIEGTGDSQDKCITQVLTLSNRTGEDGNMYIRTGHGGNINSLSWKPWATLQTNTNVGQVDDLDNLKDNGIYSGVWTKGSYNSNPLTFVCVVINDYFVGKEPRRISQFVYGLSKFDGSTVYQSRVWDDSKNAWGDWEILNQKEIAKMISDEISKIVGNAPETFDTLKELAEWIENHGTEAANMLVAINSNTRAIADETARATEAEAGLGIYISQIEESANKTNTDLTEIKKNIASSLHASGGTDSVTITGKSDVGRTTFSAKVPSATTESAGVMTADDKKKLDGVELVERISWGIENNLDDYTTEGNYSIAGNNNNGGNIPILNEGIINARLSVLVTENSGNKVVTQVLTLNNNTGGEGNVYIRSNQNGTWKPWGKLQTNVEVGQITPDDMSNLTDNGIYSGVCVDGATVETFVLIVINNYLAASQAGFGGYISQLKYAIDLNRGNTVKTRTRDAYGVWNEWSEIGGGSSEADNYLGETTIDYLRNGNHNMKSGVYYGTLSDYNGAPFILEVSTNFDNGGVQDSEKRAIKKLTISTQSYNTSVSEFYSFGYYTGTTFWFSSFNNQKPMVYNNVLTPLNHSQIHKTIYIGKFDDSLTMPQSASSGKTLYQYIINTAKSISNINSVIINITPNSVQSTSGATVFTSIVEVIYNTQISLSIIPIRYEKMIFSTVTGDVYKLQTITELEKITV